MGSSAPGVELYSSLVLLLLSPRERLEEHGRSGAAFTGQSIMGAHQVGEGGGEAQASSFLNALPTEPFLFEMVSLCLAHLEFTM